MVFEIPLSISAYVMSAYLVRCVIAGLNALKSDTDGSMVVF